MFGVEFQCPSGHFLIQTNDPLGGPLGQEMFQCPSGHFLIQTEGSSETDQTTEAGFNARQGIS